MKEPEPLVRGVPWRCPLGSASVPCNFVFKESKLGIKSSFMPASFSFIQGHLVFILLTAAFSEVGHSFHILAQRRIESLVLVFSFSVTHLYSALGGTLSFLSSVLYNSQCSSGQYLTVSCQYEREPPSPRSTPWGAYRSASHKRHRSSFTTAFSAAIHNTLTLGNCR